MIMGKEKIIPILALIVILISGTSTAYIYMTQIEKETIAINGEEYTIEQLFYIGKIITIQTTEGEKTGVSLEDLILKIGISCPTCFEYTIKGIDGYEKTIGWDILSSGILTDLYTVYFPDTPKAFWVRDIVEIEVR
jgi:hypothetical protein